MAAIRLYHTGFDEIRIPDLHRGRANADFGQGFYLSDDREFSLRWAKMRKGTKTYINSYLLETDDLSIRHFTRDRDWFEYIFANRHNVKDSLAYDVIIGPIANDTLFDTLGILTSGLLDDEQALALLMIGPVYEQTVIKSEKALSKLCWEGAEVLDIDLIQRYQETVRQEEKEYMDLFARRMQDILE